MGKSFIGKRYLALENKRIAMLKYFLLEDTKIVEETKESKNTYGICIEKWNNDNLEENSVRDITTEKENAKKIAECLMKNEVTPLHLKDIIVDML